MSNVNPRKTAVDIIYNIIKKKISYSEQISLLRKNSIYTNLDIRFINEITAGVLRNLEYIDFLISEASDVKLNKISPFVLCVLRVGVYQIMFMDKIPESAAVNESVKIIKKSSNYRLGGYVNAVLRKVSLNGMLVPQKADNIQYMSQKYSCPAWIIENWHTRVGEDTEKLLNSMNSKPDMILRANITKISGKELADELTNEGWECELYNSNLFPEIDYLIRVKKICGDIEDSISYKNGLFYIQDPAAAYVAHILNPKSGFAVFDMCASPGGKTTHFAEKMNDSGSVYAFDISDSKVNKININAERLGLTSIIAKKNDAQIPNPDYISKADCVVVDAPCSGLGIIRKKPDIKYLRKKEDINSLAKISLAILNTSASYLKSGGTLVFSTCTTTYEENEEVLFEFLRANKDFKLKKIDCTKDNDGYITLFPHQDDCDGFFISLMTKE